MARMESNEENTKRVTVRVPKDLADDYDEEVGNRSEAIRAHMKRTVKEPATDGGETKRQPPVDDDLLAQSYAVLRRLAGEKGTLPVREAESVVAAKVNIPKDSTHGRVFKPLRERGYIARLGDPYRNPWLEVR